MLTKGWDTISIVKQDQINSDLKSVWGEMDSHFSYLSPEVGSYSIEGVFDCWQVIKGGGGSLLRMQLPIKSGSLNINQSEISLAGTFAIIEITLTLVSLLNERSLLKTEYLNLAKSRSEIIPGKSGWILPVTFLDSTGQVGIYSTLVLDSICQYLLAHPEQIDIVFAEINFAKSGSPQWAIPKRSSYCYMDSGYLAVLSVCSDKDITNLPTDVDVAGLPPTASSFYVMSSELLLENIIFPGLQNIYQKCVSTDFKYLDRELFNIRDLELNKIKSGALYYTPVVFKNKNIARVSGDLINISYVGNCDMYAGITMNWNGSVAMNVVLDNKGSVFFSKVKSSFNHNEDIPWYLKWLIPIVSFIVQIVVKVISDDLISSIESSSSLIKADAINTVVWCNEQAMVKSAFLSESLIFEY
jgi:hypothetical protein